MTVLNFIKENRVLVAGLVLPLLLIGMMAISKNIPSSQPLPQYKVVYSSFVWGSNERISFKVGDNGQLLGHIIDNPNYKGSQAAKSILYLYDPKTQLTESVDVTLDTNKQPTSFGKFSTLKLSKIQPSPDGYIFQSYYNRNYSLLTDIFAYRSYPNGPVLFKKGTIHQIPMPNPYYGSPEFIGWVIDGAQK